MQGMNRGLFVGIGAVVGMATVATLVWLVSTRARTPSPAPPSVEFTPASSPSPTANPAATPSARSPKPAEPAAPKPDSAVPTTGTLLFESDVPETTVFIDRVFVGTLPAKSENVTPGSHQLTFSAPGYDGIRMTIDVEPGTRTITAKFKEIVLDERANVTHKHAIGSCAGVLRASPQGLQYETTNAGDAFSTPLPSLETFELDYLSKTLKVKIRGGKTYNFADSEGNVDRLYAFHQTVDKVRKRLISKNRP